MGALAVQDGEQHSLALQLALCHCIINLFGFVIFYPVPFMRWPLFIGKIFGSKVEKYKWFSLFYLILSFILLPLIIYGLSLINTILLYVCVCLSFTLLVLVILINILQVKKPILLPPILRDWKFLPEPLRSLNLIDFVVQTYMEVFCCCIVPRTVMLMPDDGKARKGNNVQNLGLGANLKLVKIEKK